MRKSGMLVNSHRYLPDGTSPHTSVMAWVSMCASHSAATATNTRTLKVLALRQCVVVVLGEKGVLVPADNGLEVAAIDLRWVSSTRQGGRLGQVIPRVVGHARKQ